MSGCLLCVSSCFACNRIDIRRLAIDGWSTTDAASQEQQHLHTRRYNLQFGEETRNGSK